MTLVSNQDRLKILKFDKFHREFCISAYLIGNYSNSHESNHGKSVSLRIKIVV